MWNDPWGQVFLQYNTHYMAPMCFFGTSCRARAGWVFCNFCWSHPVGLWARQDFMNMGWGGQEPTRRWGYYSWILPYYYTGNLVNTHTHHHHRSPHTVWVRLCISCLAFACISLLKSRITYSYDGNKKNEVNFLCRVFLFVVCSFIHTYGY